MRRELGETPRRHAPRDRTGIEQGTGGPPCTGSTTLGSVEKKRDGVRPGEGVPAWAVKARMRVYLADLHRARERQTASFTLLCKDAAGESMGRGGDNIQVAVVPKDKTDRFVPHGHVSWVMKLGV